MFCQQADPPAQRIRRSIFPESEKVFSLKRRKKKSLKLILFFSSCVNDRFNPPPKKKQKKKHELLKCWESLEIHLDIWSPSEGTWRKAKDTPKNDFIMRELSPNSDGIVGRSSRAEGAIANRRRGGTSYFCHKLTSYVETRKQNRAGGDCPIRAGSGWNKSKSTHLISACNINWHYLFI